MCVSFKVIHEPYSVSHKYRKANCTKSLNYRGTLLICSPTGDKSLAIVHTNRVIVLSEWP